MKLRTYAHPLTTALLMWLFIGIIANVNCVSKESAKGAFCESDEHCWGSALQCIDGFCGGPPAWYTPKDAGTPVDTPPKLKTLAFFLNTSGSKPTDFSTFSLLDIETRKFFVREGKEMKDLKADPPGLSKVVLVRRWREWLVLMNLYDSKTTPDRIDLLNTHTWKVDKSVPLGFQASPVDFVVDDQDPKQPRAFIALYNRNYILVADPLTSKEIGRIDLSSLSETPDAPKNCFSNNANCDGYLGGGSKKCTRVSNILTTCGPDGTPEIYSLYLHKAHLFVLLHQMDRNHKDVQKSKGSLAIIDANTLKLKETLPLKALPTSFIETPDKKNLWIPQFSPAISWAFSGGGMGVFSLDTQKLATEYAFTEPQMKGFFSVFGQLHLLTDTRGFMLTNNSIYKGATQSIVQFDPTKKTITGTLIKDALLSDFALNNKNEMYVAETGTEGSTNFGIRIFDTNNNGELTKALLSVSQHRTQHIHFVDVTQ